ncbi:MAG TPA: type II toxin-antitoxin system VapC family toxin [Thermoanaerobaculia bacterium]|nr:type II toxin-antitoxin system VapC family toxin [Thermoanaerobaculia bacterium]
MGDFRYLLDSNSLSDLIRHPGGKVARRFAVVGEPVVCTSIIVACELRFGAAKKGSSELSIRIDQLLASFNVLPLDREADRHYAEIRAHLSRKGQPIDSNDLLIAAHTLALDLILVTDNVDEFARVPELSIENWLAA